MFIQPISNTASYLPGLASGEQIGRNVSMMALPIIALLTAAYFVKEVSAGPLTEVGCMGACSLAAIFLPNGASWYATCMEVCVLTGFIPGP